MPYRYIVVITVSITNYLVSEARSLRLLLVPRVGSGPGCSLAVRTATSIVVAVLMGRGLMLAPPVHTSSRRDSLHCGLPAELLHGALVLPRTHESRWGSQVPSLPCNWPVMLSWARWSRRPPRSQGRLLVFLFFFESKVCLSRHRIYIGHGRLITLPFPGCVIPFTWQSALSGQSCPKLFQ